MRERGFITLPIMAWGAIAAGVVILALGVAVKVQTNRLEAVKQEYATFQAQVKALGDVAIAKAKATEAADKAKKEKSDAENVKTKRDLAGMYAAYRSLRDGPGRSLLSSPAAGSASPTVAAFDRSALDSALSGFDRGITGLIEQGDQAIIDLNTAKRWAQDK